MSNCLYGIPECGFQPDAPNEMVGSVGAAIVYVIDITFVVGYAAVVFRSLSMEKPMLGVFPKRDGVVMAIVETLGGLYFSVYTIILTARFGQAESVPLCDALGLSACCPSMTEFNPYMYSTATLFCIFTVGGPWIRLYFCNEEESWGVGWPFGWSSFLLLVVCPLAFPAWNLQTNPTGVGGSYCLQMPEYSFASRFYGIESFLIYGLALAPLLMLCDGDGDSGMALLPYLLYMVAVPIISIVLWIIYLVKASKADYGAQVVARSLTSCAVPGVLSVIHTAIFFFVELQFKKYKAINSQAPRETAAVLLMSDLTQAEREVRGESSYAPPTVEKSKDAPASNATKPKFAETSIPVTTTDPVLNVDPADVVVIAGSDSAIAVDPTTSADDDSHESQLQSPPPSSTVSIMVVPAPPLLAPQHVNLDEL